ncbi:MAG: hypothetical protein DRH24_08835 [Deltaproteobacteria bacterium]|nr:MAG: hypothetical protein DRH24_08835 [Deltaproteobacteria bacterium]
MKCHVLFVPEHIAAQKDRDMQSIFAHLPELKDGKNHYTDDGPPQLILKSKTPQIGYANNKYVKTKVINGEEMIGKLIWTYYPDDRIVADVILSKPIKWEYCKETECWVGVREDKDDAK